MRIFPKNISTSCIILFGEKQQRHWTYQFISDGWYIIKECTSKSEPQHQW